MPGKVPQQKSTFLFRKGQKHLTRSIRSTNQPALKHGKTELDTLSSALGSDDLETCRALARRFLDQRRERRIANEFE